MSIHFFSKYEIKISKKEFDTGFVKCQKTAIVTFFNKDTKEVQEYGYLDNSSIYDILKTNKEIQLDNCYIKDFELIKFNNATKTEQLRFHNISSENVFFDSPDKTIDLSNLHFLKDEISFRNSIFICKELNFQETMFNSKFVNFEYITFNCETINFSKTTFSDGDVSFKHAKFKEGVKSFEDINFGHGKVVFEDVEFGNGDVLFTNTNFNDGKCSFKVANFGKGKVDFSRCKFGTSETSFEKVNFGDGSISFRSADFQDGKVNFISSVFGDGNKSFINTEFGNGNITFKNSNFGNGKKSFRLAVFGEGSVDFHFATFNKGDIIFDRVKFKDGGIDFKAVDFGVGKTSFKKTSFGHGNIIFENCKLDGLFLMEDSVFGNGEFNLQEAEFEKAVAEIHNVDFGVGKISFQRSKFKTLSLKNSQLSNYFDLRIKSCEMLDLSNTVIKDIVDLNPYDYDAEIKAINLSGMRLLGRIYIDWRKSKIKDLIYNQKEETTRSKEEQFRILKENYSVTGLYSYEDEAYVEFKRTEAKAILEHALSDKPKEAGKFNILWLMKVFQARLKYFFNWLIFDKMGKYATDPVRVLITMVITYLLFTFVYLILAEFGNVHIISSLFDASDPEQAKKILSPIGKAFYHSSITFLTIGYGDYYPDGISRWISAIEGFVGLFQMSYFTVAFVRKVLR